MPFSFSSARSKMLRLSIRASPKTAPAASSSAKDGIFPSEEGADSAESGAFWPGAGSWAAAGPSEQAIAAQHPASNRARNASMVFSRACSARFLLRLDAGFLHDLRPFDRLRGDEAAELLRAHLRGFSALGLEALLRFSRGEDHRELPVQPLDDGTRRSGRRDDAPPVGRLVAGHARLRDRRQVGEGGDALRAAHAQRL